jgi:RNA polymerase sigma factor (sigma-70 family)
MAAGPLKKVVQHLRRAVTPREGDRRRDGELLEGFITRRDEDAFAALVRRHGPMVLGVCRRLLGHAQDAEDAFQATFLVLARKAATVVPRQAVGNWLYGVAYRTAQEARVMNARRRRREKQVADLPHPEVAPAEPKDWRPVLDGELSRLPDKYRLPIVLCDLEGRSRREVARQLNLPEGTLSSRLAMARRTLARRLARCGLGISGGSLATALAEGASAAVPAPLVALTVRAAALVAAGQAAAVSTPAAVLMKGVLKAMFLAKLKIVAATAMVVLALGAGGVVYHVAAGPGAAQAAAPEGKAPADADALRKENELLKLNLQLTLEKILSQEAELRTLRGRAEAAASEYRIRLQTLLADKVDQADVQRRLLGLTNPVGLRTDAVRMLDLTRQQVGFTEDLRSPLALPAVPDPMQEVEAALKSLREARDKEAKQRAAEALEKALKKLRQQLK